MICHENRQKGLTLFELLVAIAIVGILAAFAVPNMLSFINKQRVKATANDIVTLINSAKAEAVKHNAPIVVTAGLVKADGKLDGTASSWTDGNAAISYLISNRSIYGNIDYTTNQDTQIANFKKNVKVVPKIRLDSSVGGNFNDDTKLMLIAYPNGSMKIASPPDKRQNATIEEGVTVQIPVCVETKCKNVIVASNRRAYIGDPPEVNAAGSPPTTVEPPAAIPTP